MSSWQLPLVSLVLLCGLFGAVLPGVPGRLGVWAGIFWWSSADGTSRAWWVLVIATSVLLAEQAIQWLLPAGNLREAGVRRRQLVLAGGTGIMGFFLVPVVGVVPGFLGGLYGWERLRLGSHGAALASTRTIMRKVGRRKLVALTGCLLVVAVWLGALITG